VPRGFTGLDTTGDLDRTRKKQQLFGERRFTGIRVRNNGERSASRDFCLNTQGGEFYRLAQPA